MIVLINHLTIEEQVELVATRSWNKVVGTCSLVEVRAHPLFSAGRDLADLVYFAVTRLPNVISILSRAKVRSSSRMTLQSRYVSSWRYLLLKTCSLAHYVFDFQ